MLLASLAYVGLKLRSSSIHLNPPMSENHFPSSNLETSRSTRHVWRPRQFQHFWRIFTELLTKPTYVRYFKQKWYSQLTGKWTELAEQFDLDPVQAENFAKQCLTL